MLSAGILAPLADSTAALSRRLPLVSAPPLRAATVISRRIFENSFPRWTSVLPFLRLICDHRECPDMVSSPSLVHRSSDLLHPLQPALAPLQGLLPAPPLDRRLRHERPAGLRAHVRPHVDEGEI